MKDKVLRRQWLPTRPSKLSVVCRVRSVRLDTTLLMSDGAIPVSAGSLLVLFGFRQPVIIRQVSFSVASSFFAWVERSHTWQAFSGAE